MTTQAKGELSERYAAMPQPGKKLNGMNRTRIYIAAGLGKIRLVKAGRQTLVDLETQVEYLNSLPEAQIAAPSRMQAA